MNLGPYERNCRAHWVGHNDPMPDDFSFQLFPDDLERLEHYLDDAVRRVPMLGKAGLSKVINGPIPYAPDGNPLIGPMPGVPNAFEACVFTFGIAQAGGAGKVLAEWVTAGPDRVGHVVVRPAPLHGLCLRARLLRRQGHGDLRQRICDQLPAPRLAGRPRPQAVADPRSHQGARRPVQRLQWLGARHLVRQTGRRHFRSRRPRRSAATDRGSRASARRRWPCATPPASSTCPASRASGCRAKARATGCRR